MDVQGYDQEGMDVQGYDQEGMDVQGYDQGYYLDAQGNRQKVPSKAEMSKPVKYDYSAMSEEIADMKDEIEILNERLYKMQRELDNIEPEKILYKDQLDQELSKSSYLTNRLSNEMSMDVNAHRSEGDEHEELWEGVGGGKRRKKYSKKKKKSKSKRSRKSKRKRSKTRRRI